MEEGDTKKKRLVLSLVLIFFVIVAISAVVATSLIVRRRIITYQKAESPNCDSEACVGIGTTNNLVCSEGGYSGNGDGKSVARNCNGSSTQMLCVAHAKIFTSREECESFDLNNAHIDSSSGVEPFYFTNDSACYGLSMYCEHPISRSGGCYATQSDIKDGFGHLCYDKKKDCSLCPEKVVPPTQTPQPTSTFTPTPTSTITPTPTGTLVPAPPLPSGTPTCPTARPRNLNSTCYCSKSGNNCNCDLGWSEVPGIGANDDYLVRIWDVTDGTYNGLYWGHRTSVLNAKPLNSWRFTEAEPNHSYKFRILAQKTGCADIQSDEEKAFSCNLCEVEPTAPPGDYCICAQAKIYEENWTHVEDLRNIKAGKTYHLTVFAQASKSDMYPGRARFRINGAANNTWCLGSGRTVINNWCEVNGEGRHVGHTGNQEYFVDFKIPEAGGTFTVETEVFCPTLGWK